MMNNRILSCDWGTSAFRLRLIDVFSGEIVAESFSGEGIAAVYALWKNAGHAEEQRMHFYFSVILRHIRKIEQYTGSNAGGMQVIISGMASSAMGMLELPYKVMPFAADGSDLEIKRIDRQEGISNDLIIISGARSGSDVMRGEELQLIGCLDENISGTRVYIFTGTHSKHVTAINREATDMATFMTGEFFELLSGKSILSDSVEGGLWTGNSGNSLAFEQGVQDSCKQNLLHSSFMVRTNQLFKRFSKTENYFYLSGLLIGTELGTLLKREMNALIIVGDEKLLPVYVLAVKVLGIKTKILTIHTGAATVRGHLAVYRRMGTTK